MQALIDFIIRNLMALWPIARVNQWEQGLVLRCGKNRRRLKPGVHWRWWFIEEVKTCYATELTVDLPNASVVTTDGTSIIVSANIAYIIDDMSIMWSKLANSSETLKNVALGFLATECSMRSWEELTTDRIKLQAQLTEHMQTMVGPWGIKMTRVYLTDLVPVRQYRLFNDTPVK